MYKDNSLIPSEAVRLAALGLLAKRPRVYADLARRSGSVIFFNSANGPKMLLPLLEHLQVAPELIALLRRMAG